MIPLKKYIWLAKSSLQNANGILLIILATSAVISTNIASILIFASCVMHLSPVFIIITFHCRFYVNYFWWYKYFVNTVIVRVIILLQHVFNTPYIVVNNDESQKLTIFPWDVRVVATIITIY